MKYLLQFHENGMKYFTAPDVYKHVLDHCNRLVYP